MDALKLEKLNEGIINPSGIDLMLIIIIINLGIHALSFKK